MQMSADQPSSLWLALAGGFLGGIFTGLVIPFCRYLFNLYWARDEMKEILAGLEEWPTNPWTAYAVVERDIERAKTIAGKIGFPPLWQIKRLEELRTRLCYVRGLVGVEIEFRASEKGNELIIADIKEAVEQCREKILKEFSGDTARRRGQCGGRVRGQNRLAQR
jgi:hypothetical protein